MARKVLIIDDDELIRRLMRLYISGLGAFYFIEASNGVSGLSLVHQQSPDLIIADLMMPVMTGIKLTKEVRQISDERGKIPIIIVTGANDAMKAEAYNAGANYVLEKPLSRRSLVSALGSIFK